MIGIERFSVLYTKIKNAFPQILIDFLNDWRKNDKVRRMSSSLVKSDTSPMVI